MFSGTEELAALHRAYEEKSHIRVIDGEGPADTAVVFFSSKGLYNANDFRDFEEKILKKDRFEWENVARDPEVIRHYGKIVLIRDILLDWCMQGISPTVNTPKKLGAYLRDLLGADCRVTTCGSSAGAFTALLFGTMIDAERILVFAPLCDMMVYDRARPVQRLDEYRADPERAPYLSLADSIAAYSGTIYYFYAGRAQMDIDHYRVVEAIPGIRFFNCRQKKHGSTVAPDSMVRLLAMDDDRRDALCRKFRGRSFGRYAFLRATHGTAEGTRRFIAILWRKGCAKLRKR